jgi:MHS family alpha-ketoglutarate permease-like MFS transporter
MATAVAAGTEDRGALWRLRSIVGGSAGNLVEIYDWFAYTTFAIYFAKAFFPKGDETLQLLNTAAVFAVGFLFRPIGAWLMGLYADRAGRKNAMVLSVQMMCLGSMVIALCPAMRRSASARPRCWCWRASSRA